MVLLLNYIHWLVALCAVYLFFLGVKKRSKKLAVAALVLAMSIPLLLASQTSYVAKGGVERLPVPVFEKRDDLVVQDRLRKPAKTDEEAKRDFDQMVDWEAKRDSAKAKEE